MAAQDGLTELKKELHRTQDLLEAEVEQRRLVESELVASQIRCAGALEENATLKASFEVRLAKRSRSLMARIPGVGEKSAD